MNENFPPKTPTLNDWIRKAVSLFNDAGINSARLDAELVLSHTLRKPRTYLHAHGEEQLSRRHEEIADARLQMRLEHTPVAYIIGHKEFYGRQFKTTPAALIPRPESEAIVEVLKGIMPQKPQLLPEKMLLVDVGTGTGCLGITAKLEWPRLDVTLIDTSTHALNLANENAKALRADVHFLKNDLLYGYSSPVDIIVANLPYVDRSWDVSPETNAEPSEALYADNDGLALITKLIGQAAALLSPGGHLVLESDPRQHDKIISMAHKYGFTHNGITGLVTHFRVSRYRL